MIKITDKSQCSGCTACEAVCGRKAITMTADTQGFGYPVVDIDLCVECGLCEKVCPFTKPVKSQQDFQQEQYGCRLKSQEELNRSQSGGAFKAIGDWAIRNGYTVYGVYLNENLEARHTSANTIEELNRFRGSKYVQSNLDGIFREVTTKLRNGENILFVGTGCQVAGLASLCATKKIDTARLLTIDLICYGVPSPQYWQDYLRKAEKEYGCKIIRANFRDKEEGWASSQNSLILEDGRKVFPKHNFYHPILFRRSCNKCPFTSFTRTSDITIGDFWGIERIRPEIAADNRGVSLALINTAKGQLLFTQIQDTLQSFKTNREECRQQQLSHPNPQHPAKDKWEKAYENSGYEAALKTTGINTTPKPLRIFLGKIKRKLLSTLRK